MRGKRFSIIRIIDKSQKKISIITTLALTFLILLSYSACSDNKVKQPNIVLIMADDMGYSDIGCYGGEIETPNIDRLAEGGLRFRQFYNNAKCSPTRASLLTGLYSQQVGIHDGPAKMENCVTLAEVLKSSGYRTLMTGKWHTKELPVERGFDRYYGLCDGCCNYFNPGEKREGEAKPAHKRFPRKWAIDDKVIQPFTPVDLNFYTTDVFTDNALQYLDEYVNDENPFFLYVAYTAPHYPLHARPEDIEKYRGKYMQGWDIIRKQRYQKMINIGLIDPQWKMSPRSVQSEPWQNINNKNEWDMKMAVYAAMVDRLDQNIGRILDKINDLGEEENTLILFLSDNGGCAEDVNLTPEVPPGSVNSYRTVNLPWANAQNTPFRKFKRWDHEGGISTPLIAYWPRVIHNGGIITNQIGHVIDVMATVLEITKSEYPKTFDGRKILPLQGKSLLPIFQGKQREGHEFLFWQFRDARAVRKGDWKLVDSGEKGWELFNMKSDRTELKDLSDKYPDLVSELEHVWLGWAKECNANIEYN